MNDEIQMSISIPTDDDGYALLKCDHCGNLFKVMPSDAQDDGVLQIYCPSCGLISDNYLTEDVLNLAMNMAENIANDYIYDMVKDLERKSNKYVKIKAGNRPIYKSESPLHSGIEALESGTFSCCGRTAKIKPLLKIAGAYCPFCGVKDYEIE